MPNHSVGRCERLEKERKICERRRRLSRSCVHLIKLFTFWARLDKITIVPSISVVGRPPQPVYYFLRFHPSTSRFIAITRPRSTHFSSRLHKCSLSTCLPFYKASLILHYGFVTHRKSCRENVSPFHLLSESQLGLIFSVNFSETHVTY